MKIKLCTYFAVALFAVLVAGCGSDKADSSANSSASQTSSATGATASSSSDNTANTATGKPPAVSGSLKTKPTIAAPEGSPPTKLVIKDIKRGHGKTAKRGDQVSVQYVGISWSNGAEFDASWTHGQPFQFALGTGGVIAGWDKGVAGMKVGGRRELVIPPALGYGAAGSPPAIAGDETLVFVVDLVKVKQ